MRIEDITETRIEDLAILCANCYRVTVPGKPSDDLAPGTLNSILKQSGLKK